MNCAARVYDKLPQSQVANSSQLEVLEADSFVLHSLHTLTGLKFFISAEPDARHLDQVTHARNGLDQTAAGHAASRRAQVLRDVYILYSDYVLKNPFYELDMPIHCEKFDLKLAKLADDYHKR